MRNLSIFIVLFISTALLAQTPASFNYQAVVRDASGDEVANQKVSFRISILEGSETGTPIYVETHSVTTNEFGLANLAVGEGTAETGTLSPKGWGNQPHYLKVELDPEGGTSYQHLGTSPLLAVPYAFHAETVSQDAVNDDDADPANEIQSLSLSGSDLSLSDGGGTVTLPAGGGGLWNENGNWLFAETNVGIGTDEPSHDLDLVNNTSSLRLKSTGTGFGVDGDAFLLLDKASVGKNANLNLQTDGNTQFYAGLLGSNDFRISTSLYAFNGLEVQQDGDVGVTGDMNIDGDMSVKVNMDVQEDMAVSGDMAVNGDMAVTGEVQTAASGNANMVPIAYGTVISGQLEVSSGNVSVEGSDPPGRWTITIDGQPNSNSIDFTASVTSLGHTGFITVGDNSTLGGIEIFTYNMSGFGVSADFMFVIYKP